MVDLCLRGTAGQQPLERDVDQKTSVWARQSWNDLRLAINICGFPYIVWLPTLPQGIQIDFRLKHLSPNELKNDQWISVSNNYYCIIRALDNCPSPSVAGWNPAHPLHGPDHSRRLGGMVQADPHGPKEFVNRAPVLRRGRWFPVILPGIPGIHVAIVYNDSDATRERERERDSPTICPMLASCHHAIVPNGSWWWSLQATAGNVAVVGVMTRKCDGTWRVPTA